MRPTRDWRPGAAEVDSRDINLLFELARKSVTVHSPLGMSDGAGGKGVFVNEDDLGLICVARSTKFGSTDYPEDDGTFKAYPIKLLPRAWFDQGSAEAIIEEHIESGMDVCYNLAHVYIPENKYFLVARINGKWWTYCRGRTVIVGKANSNIAAMTGDAPGSGEVTLYRYDSASEEFEATEEIVIGYNLASQEVTADVYLQLKVFDNCFAEGADEPDYIYLIDFESCEAP